MQVGFAGTPAFAATALAAIVDAGFEVPLVLTRPDRPQGRGLRLLPSPVKTLAQERDLPVEQPATLKTHETRTAVLAVPLDVLIVAAYGLILPPEVLAWPRHGCINIHSSLLPRWRGAAPIERAILEGDAETGVTIMQMDTGLDTGAMIDRERTLIEPDDTAGTLTARLAALGAAAIVAALSRLRDAGRLESVAQPAVGATYAAKIAKSEAVIDWRDAAAAIARRVRAFDPAPGTSGVLAGRTIKVWRAESALPAMPGAPPGRVVAADARGIAVACGEGTLRILELQMAGGRRMDAAAFVAGRHVVAGASFDAVPAHDALPRAGAPG